MNKTLSCQPILSIDLKKNRIRVHKVTLELLGNPEYILLMVNPHSQVIAVQSSNPKDYLAHRVNMEVFADGNCYELYSQKLVNRLCKVNSDWKRNMCYRIYGHLEQHNNIACFRMQDITPINSD